MQKKKALSPTWYVVANRTDAVFYVEGRDLQFHFVDRLANKTGDLREAGLVSDRPGTGLSSTGSGALRHGLAGRTTHHELLALKFARKIASSLKVARNRKRFGQLVLVAEPHFMGLLKGALDAGTTRTISHEVGHEYAQGSDSKVRSQIMQAIQA